MDEFMLWLLEFVATEHDILAYSSLFNELQSTPFVAVLKRDNDRVGDADLQRIEYMNEVAVFDSIDISEGPSVLEVLVALARKLDDLIGYPSSSPQRWFWYMIASLGLEDFENSRFDQTSVDDILQKFLRREYSPDGKGGCCFFPCGKDMREIDIWYQWMYYLNSLDEFKEDIV